MAAKTRKRTHQFLIKELPHWPWRLRYFVQAIVCNNVLATRITEGEVGALREKDMLEKRYQLAKIEIHKKRVRVMEMRKYDPKDF